MNPYQDPIRKFTLYNTGAYELNSISLFVVVQVWRQASCLGVVNLLGYKLFLGPNHSSKVYKGGKRLVLIALDDRF